MMFYSFTIKIRLPTYQVELAHISSFNYSHIFVSSIDMHITNKKNSKFDIDNKKLILQSLENKKLFIHYKF
jgi:hypothetical protein